MPAAQAMAESKCIVAIKCNGVAKTKKLKIFNLQKDGRQQHSAFHV